VPRPTGSDPFQEAPEPRLPPGGDPEEKLRAFRTMVKLKDEALARGRGLYAAVDQEAQALRQVALQIKSQLEAALVEAARGAEYPQQILALKEMLEKDTIRAESAERKMDELVSRLAESDADRKDLTQALAEIETQFSEQKAQLEAERQTREQLAEELVGAKEALGLSQDRVSELAASASDVKGQLEAATEEYQRYAREAEDAHLHIEKVREELATVTSERDGQ
jgi:chromosome segregation ATPase